MTRFDIIGNTFNNIKWLSQTCDKDGVWRCYLIDQRRLVVDCRPDGKWRLGDTVGTVPKGHDCIIEGFVIRRGKTVKRGKATIVPNGGKEINYIPRDNDVG